MQELFDLESTSDELDSKRSLQRFMFGRAPDGEFIVTRTHQYIPGSDAAEGWDT